jgi:hypothetical protein
LLPPSQRITPAYIVDKIAKAEERVVISTTAFTFQQVIDALKSGQVDEKTVLVSRHDFQRVQTWLLAAEHLVKAVVGPAVVEHRRDRADTSWRSTPAVAGG